MNKKLICTYYTRNIFIFILIYSLDWFFLKGSIIWVYSILDFVPAAPAKLYLCDPIDSSPPGFAIPGILQARTLEWVAISFSNAWKWKGQVKSLSRVWLFMTPWTVARRAPLSMGFPGKNTIVGCHAFLQGIFPTQGSNSGLPHWRWILYHLSYQGSPRILD